MKQSGTYSCDGSCQATMPLDSDCPTSGITLTHTPATVAPGGTCKVQWSTDHATSCTLMNLTTRKAVASGLQGTYQAVVASQTDFRIHCKDGTVVTTDADVSCRVTPH